jgi:hypothetical protein
MSSGVDSRKFNVDGTAGLFQCPVFFPSVLGSAIPKCDSTLLEISILDRVVHYYRPALDVAKLQQSSRT